VNICATRTFRLGPYTVQQRPREDSPAWAQYRVFLGAVLIGKSFSIPDLGCCAWLEQQMREGTFYAYSSAKLPTMAGDRKTNPRGHNQHDKRSR